MLLRWFRLTGLVSGVMIALLSAAWCQTTKEAVAPQVAAPKGALVIAGGGRLPQSIGNRALELAGGPQVAVVVIPQASSREDAGDRGAKAWRERGAQDVRVLQLDDPQSVRVDLTRAQLIWISGGSQNRLMDRIRDTEVPALLKQRFYDGAVVGGTSAGAAVMSAVMITGGAVGIESRDNLRGILTDTTETAAGLGMCESVIFDQHFHKRQRFNRLLSVVLSHPQLLGMGIDESTAVVVQQGECSIVGDSNVLVLDARESAVTPGASATPASARNCRLHVLRPGDRFRLPKVKAAPRGAR